jgi:hypothetical protein
MQFVFILFFILSFKTSNIEDSILTTRQHRNTQGGVTAQFLGSDEFFFRRKASGVVNNILFIIEKKKNKMR